MSATLDIVVATGNAGKVAEFRDLLGGDRFRWLGLKDLPHVDEIPETGRTFRDNAVLKASGYAKALGKWALADDSGLEVDALGGSPGVYSARWAERHDAGHGDAANNALLLEQLKTVPDEKRTGRFVCVLALANPAGVVVLTARDTMDGRVNHAAVGGNGFGYDPLFVVDGIGRTSAELSPAEKHRVSHRGKALRRLGPMFDRIGSV